MQNIFNTQQYPLGQIKPQHKNINILFTGFKTGYNPQNSRLKTLQKYPKGKQDTINQAFRWQDIQKARQWLSKHRKKQHKINIIGYSLGADAANQLARQYKSPVTLIQPVTLKKNNIVPWADVALSDGSVAQNKLDRFFVDLIGKADEHDLKNNKITKYKGNHWVGVNSQINKALNKSIDNKDIKSQDPIYRKGVELAYKIAPFAGAGIGAALGLSLSRALRSPMYATILMATGGMLAGGYTGTKITDKLIGLINK